MLRMFFLFMLPLCISNQQYTKLNDKPKELSDAQRWALGASGMLASRNHLKFDSLAGCEINAFNIKEWKSVIERDWGINNRKDLLDELRWLEHSGHNARYERFVKLLLSLQKIPGHSYLFSFFEKNTKFRYNLVLVNKYHKSLGSKGILGWDTERYICLCRWGYICGYLTEKEAWEKIMPAARFLQKTFDSWDDLGTNYIIGREFWSPNDEDRYLFYDTHIRLLEMSSPCKDLPWNLSLGQDNYNIYHKNINNNDNYNDTYDRISAIIRIIKIIYILTRF
jgi:hypothetical protein